MTYEEDVEVLVKEPGFIYIHPDYRMDERICKTGWMSHLLYIYGLMIESRLDSSGVVPFSELSRPFPRTPQDEVRASADELVEVGMWSKEGPDYRIVVWLDSDHPDHFIDSRQPQETPAE